MNRLISAASVSALLLAAAVLAGALWWKTTQELPRHNRLDSGSPALAKELAVHDFLPEPRVSPDRSLEPTSIRRYSGRWLGAFETNHFRPQGSTNLFWLSGNGEVIWSLYNSRVTEPQRQAAKDGFDQAHAFPNHLCIDTDLVGVLIPPDHGGVFGGLNVHKVLRADPVDVSERECLYY